MRKLLLSTTIVAASAFAAVAQDQGELFRTEVDTMEVRASDFIGMRVYSSETPVDAEEFQGVQEGWEDIGEVNDVILSREGNVEAVLVDIGGFLGIGERQVAVDMDALRFVSDSATGEVESDFFIVMSASRDAFEQAPEYGMTGQTDPAMGDQAATDPAMQDPAMQDGTDTAETDPAMQDPAMQDGTDTAATDPAMQDPAMQDTDTAATDPAMQDPAMQDGTDTAATDPAMQDPAMQDTDTAATDPALQGSEQGAAGTDTAASGQVIEGDQQTTAQTDPAMQDGITRDGYMAAEAEYVTSDNLTGATVYDANDERVGSISDLILTADGQIEHAVVDIGGFLGIGAKPVAIQLGDLNILRANEGDDLRVYVSSTREQLEALPRFEG